MAKGPKESEEKKIEKELRKRKSKGDKRAKEKYNRYRKGGPKGSR
jgi:hypothetical protein